MDESIERLATIVLNCGLQLHREIGPGLLESVYEDVLADRLKLHTLTYIRLMNLPLGLLLNFGNETFKQGIRRVVNDRYVK